MVCLLRPVSQPDAFDMEEEDFKAKNGGSCSKKTRGWGDESHNKTISLGLDMGRAEEYMKIELDLEHGTSDLGTRNGI